MKFHVWGLLWDVLSIHFIQTHWADQDVFQKRKNQFFEIQDGKSTLRVIQLVNKLSGMENDTK